LPLADMKRLSGDFVAQLKSALFIHKIKSHYWCGMAKPILRQSLRKIAPPAVD
ncbi:MAG: hypothetical protein RL232_416, partial [Actinomycetota bacterium]